MMKTDPHSCHTPSSLAEMKAKARFFEILVEILDNLAQNATDISVLRDSAFKETLVRLHRNIKHESFPNPTLCTQTRLHKIRLCHPQPGMIKSTHSSNKLRMTSQSKRRRPLSIESASIVTHSLFSRLHSATESNEAMAILKLLHSLIVAPPIDRPVTDHIIPPERFNRRP
ncbi:hypothetical protein BLNAU_25069 [Blattamonas nauphoetae]|uniref:Uncharacterized protein n=1 Tax=Blattamonas nauphoetae TaxID=2049346 RepID=A0ABQ9WKL5_9EUKA|nr:hypothetical protein BLNAU_25069 [Blattamonas nauphoetae]